MLQWRVIAALLVTGFGLGVSDSAQETFRGNPALVIDSLYGPDVFTFYCASCHGRDGRGSGPVAVALKTRPPDLTEIARRNNGVFPKARVEAFVTNREVSAVPAHGSAEMPVWGPTFRGLDPSDARVKVRIANLVAHIEALQMK
jgi:hypothetical protein